MRNKTLRIVLLSSFPIERYLSISLRAITELSLFEYFLQHNGTTTQHYNSHREKEREREKKMNQHVNSHQMQMYVKHILC